MTGIPFHPNAPAGEILERIVEETIKVHNYHINQNIIQCFGHTTIYYLKWAMTNVVVCCSEGSPPETCIKSCLPRLSEFIKMAKPKLLVAVGKVADSTIIKEGLNKQTKMTVIAHPSWMLRQEDPELEIQRAILTLREALDVL